MPPSFAVNFIRLPALAAMALALAGASPVCAAEAWYRAAFEGPANNSQDNSNGSGNTLRVGPVGIDLSTNLALEYNSNVLLAPVARAGTRVNAALTFDANWKASKIQSLRLNGEYVQHLTLSGPGKNSSTLDLSPGSALRYNVFVADVRISPFLNVSRRSDPSASPTANNTETYRQTASDLGLQVDVPMRGQTLQLMGVRGWTSSSSASQPKITAQRDAASARLLRTFRTGLDAGVDAFVVRQNYGNGPAGASHGRSASVFVNSTLNARMKVQASLGYDHQVYERSTLAGDSTIGRSLRQQLEFSHRLSRSITYTLRGENSLGEGVTSNYYQIRELSFLPSFQLRPNTDLQLEAGWQSMRESLANGERGTRRNAGATVHQDLSHGLVLRVQYRQVQKSSNLPARTYRQRTLELALTKDL